VLTKEVISTPTTPHITTATDLEQVTAAMSDAYSEVSVRVPRAGGEPSMHLEAFALPNMNLADLRLTTSTVHSRRYPWFAVCLPVSGRIRLSTNKTSSIVAGRRGVVVSPDSAVQVDYLTDDCQMRTLLFERSVVETELSMMLGRSAPTPVRFDFRLQNEAGSSFERALTLLRAELAGQVGITDVPVMAARLGRLVAAGLLVSQPHNYSDELTRPSGFQGPRAIRTAIATIEERPAEIVTVADIARACGLSVRALDEGFRRHVGLSPMTYLRQVRLARVHDELLNADGERATATVVARHWGFAHYGRFAAEYRRKYGRTPAETLKTPPGLN
jgi:AraC-like DNA-binding protein